MEHPIELTFRFDFEFEVKLCSCRPRKLEVNSLTNHLKTYPSLCQPTS